MDTDAEWMEMRRKQLSLSRVSLAEQIEIDLKGPSNFNHDYEKAPFRPLSNNPNWEKENEDFLNN